MNKVKIKAFTLVELIVVITILTILSTIAFLSFQGYSRDARESVRITDMKSIQKGLEFLLTQGKTIPLPDDKIEITASGKIIGYQGYAGKTVLNKIKLFGGAKDPKSDQYYTYMTNTKLNKYEILGYLEGEIELSLIQNMYALDLRERYPKVVGKKLGILLDSGSLNPVQDDLLNIDIVNTNRELKAYIDDKNIISGTGSEIVKLGSRFEKFKSCNDIINKYGVGISDGIYMINPNGTNIFEVYCDMTTKGGGWTKINKRLLGEEYRVDTTSSIEDNNYGANISVGVTKSTCDSIKDYFIYIGNNIDWSKIKFKQEFYGGTSCWGIFGDGYYNTKNYKKSNLKGLTSGNIFDEYKMNTKDDDIFNGKTKICDNSTTSNFWHSNKGTGLRYSTVILDKNNINIKGGLYTEVNCNTLSTKWIYKDIFVK